MGRRRACAVALALLALLMCAPVPSHAQALERLHVKSFDLSVDKDDVMVGDTVNVVLDTKLSDVVPQLDNVTLPQLYGFDVLGDERACVSSSGSAGTECTERIAISPTRPGSLVVGPAALEALDPRTARALRYQSNFVTIHVADNPNAATTDAPTDLFAPLMRFLTIALIVVVVCVLVFFGVIFFLARRLAAPSAPPPVVAVAAVAPAPVPPIDPEARLAALVRALESEPTRARVLDLRAELRSRVGAGEKETLADLTARRAGDERVLHLLAIIERAAFVQDAFVADAARHAVAQLRAILIPAGGQA